MRGIRWQNLFFLGSLSQPAAKHRQVKRRGLALEALEARQMAFSDWHNIVMPCDVTADGKVDNADLTVLQVTLNLMRGNPTLPRLSPGQRPQYYYDVNNDNQLTTTDLQLVTNFLRYSNGGSSSTPSITPAPTPGPGGNSPTTPTNPAPTAPALDLSLLADTSNRVQVKWTPRNISPAGYEVTYAEGSLPASGAITLKTKDLFAVLTGLKANTRYTIRVTAIDAAGVALQTSTQSVVTLALEAVNTYDLERAIKAGMKSLENLGDRDNGGIPNFYVWAMTTAQAKSYGDRTTGRGATAQLAFDRHMVSNVSGRSLYALLLGQEVTGQAVRSDVLSQLESFVLKSLHKPRDGNYSNLDPANQMVTGLAADPQTYRSQQFDFTLLYNMGAGFRGALGLATLAGDPNAKLAGYAWSARHVFEQSVDNLRRYYVYKNTIGGPRVYNWEQFRNQLGLKGGDLWANTIAGDTKSNWSGIWKDYADPFLVYSLVKYYEATGHQASLELAKELRDLSFYQRFPTNPAQVPVSSFTHMYETVGEMNAYSRLALVTGDADMMERVRVRYEVLKSQVIGKTGWVPENLKNKSDVGELNNTGELVETALNLAQWGFTQYYQDSERFTRGQLLPAQLLDTSFVKGNSAPKNDGERDVANRVRGAFGFAAPYGHVATKNPYFTGGYFADITAGAVASIAEVEKAAYVFASGTHQISMLFDVNNEKIKIVSPYPNGDKLIVTPKVAGDVVLRLPSWADRAALTASLTQQGLTYQISGSTVRIVNPQANKSFYVAMPLAAATEKQTINGRQMTIQWRGDSVAAMSRMGTPMPFFPAI